MPKMTHGDNRYDQETLISNALETGLVQSREAIPTFRYAHYKGIQAIVEYYNYLPRNMMSAVYKPSKDLGNRLLRELINNQYDGKALDEIIASETKILREQIQLYNMVINHNSRYPILTKDHVYSLPIHSSERVDLEDAGYRKVARVILDEMASSPDLLRTRGDVERFIREHRDLPHLGPEVVNGAEKLICYLKENRII